MRARLALVAWRWQVYSDLLQLHCSYRFELLTPRPISMSLLSNRKLARRPSGSALLQYEVHRPIWVAQRTVLAPGIKRGRAHCLES
jgi:hypothetical protein